MENIAKKPLDEFLSFFGGNPFTTPVGQKIEQATDSSLASENWSLNMEICDLVNYSEENAKDAIRAIRRRLLQNTGKNYTVVMYTLTVLETCVKNCGKRFHTLVCHKVFIQDLVKIIGAKNDPPTVVQEKILGLIQSLADAFKGDPELNGVVQIYEDLKSKGVEFPMTDLDSMAPILTPRRSVEAAEPILHPVDLGERMTQISPEQAVKIRRDLDIVQGNMSVFAEMISEVKPGKVNAEDFQLMEELHSTCKEMQKRITELLSCVTSDELTGEMLHINDELNNLFLRYSRCRNNFPKSEPVGKSTEKSLIDFGGSGTGEPDITETTSKINALKLNSGSGSKPKQEDNDFDMFAQSRGASFDKSKSSGSTYADNINVSQGSSLGAAAMSKDVEDDILKNHKPSDFDEMEEWLKANSNPNATPKPEASLSSSEFDQFLAERAAASKLSTKSVDKEKTENKMFGL